MTAESLALVSGVILSLLFSYIPGLNSKYKSLDGVYKRLVMLGLLLLVSGVIYGIACLGWAASIGIAVTCDQAGVIELGKGFVLAMIANQTTYSISPQVGNKS